ncbi:MAG TPA: dUTP diphosphatase [Solirubrobacterales bacterium]|nr:dUTP diphosphatase [Solirubrobacterales bacterium]
MNGSWDPLAAVMADEGEAKAAVEDDRWSRDAAEPDFDQLEFTRLSESATLPTRAHDGDAGLDLYAAEAATIAPGRRVSVGTGLAVAIPVGLAGLVVPRSGLALKHGIALVNSPGVVDSGYRGELRVLLLNTDAVEEFRLSPGDRIAQLLLTPVAAANPLEADSLDSTGRGDGGFGSTGD